MRRRSFLTAMVGGLGTVAGCISDEDPTGDDGDSSDGDSGSSPSNDPAPSSNSEPEPEPEPEPETLIDKRRTIDEDGNWRVSWNLNRQVTLTYDFTVRSGPEVEVFVLDTREFDEYQAGNRFRPLVHTTGISGSGEVTLEEGEYRLVVDNTDAGEVQPPTNFDDDPVDVELYAEALATS